MGRLETVEKESKQKTDTLNRRIDTLGKENLALKEENRQIPSMAEKTPGVKPADRQAAQEIPLRKPE